MNQPTPKIPTSQLSHDPERCAVFCKTKEKFGGLSNMCAGFPLHVNGQGILTSEALYQALRFPDHPDVQRLIIASRSPMGAKMIAKSHIAKTRPDWVNLCEEAMWWSLCVKLLQNYDAFAALLASTTDKPIVEKSHNNRYWGAVPYGDRLVGRNVLGVMLVALRTVAQDRAVSTTPLGPPVMPSPLLFGQPILTVTTRP